MATRSQGDRNTVTSRADHDTSSPVGGGVQAARANNGCRTKRSHPGPIARLGPLADETLFYIVDRVLGGRHGQPRLVIDAYARPRAACARHHARGTRLHTRFDRTGARPSRMGPGSGALACRTDLG